MVGKPEDKRIQEALEPSQRGCKDQRRSSWDDFRQVRQPPIGARRGRWKPAHPARTYEHVCRGDERPCLERGRKRTQESLALSRRDRARVPAHGPSPRQAEEVAPSVGARGGGRARAEAAATRIPYKGEDTMARFQARDGTELYYKDWGSGQPWSSATVGAFRGCL